MPKRHDHASLRIALCDIRDPEIMAERVLALCWPDGTGPVPVEDIAHQLDIHEISHETLVGCEGMLLTDRVRSVGSILVNDAHGHEGRIRFTIAHELGHFLLEHHEFLRDESFICTRQDMKRLSMKRSSMNNQHARQEMEANHFAGALLAPRSCFVPFLHSTPNIRDIHGMAAKLQISRQTALRRLIDLHTTPMAVVFARSGIISVAPRHDAFPWLHGIKGHTVPADITALARTGAAETAWHPSADGAWCNPRHGAIWQQVHISARGHMTILLRRQAA